LTVEDNPKMTRTLLALIALAVAIPCCMAVPAAVHAAAQGGQTMLPAPPDVAAPPADAKRTASGLAYKVLQPGKGVKHPTATNSVTVHYTGWTTDGEMFDSSVTRNQTATFPLNRVIAGWTEGVQLMVEGEKARFWIPGSLAYDNSTRPGVPKGMLVFDIELISIQ
jgi:FKBP-type peptidyl-prolyl cis-trans isomerase